MFIKALITSTNALVEQGLTISAARPPSSARKHNQFHLFPYVDVANYHGVSY